MKLGKSLCMHVKQIWICFVDVCVYEFGYDVVHECVYDLYYKYVYACAYEVGNEHVHS